VVRTNYVVITTPVHANQSYMQVRQLPDPPQFEDNDLIIADSCSHREPITRDV